MPKEDKNRYFDQRLGFTNKVFHKSDRILLITAVRDSAKGKFASIFILDGKTGCVLNRRRKEVCFCKDLSLVRDLIKEDVKEYLEKREALAH